MTSLMTLKRANTALPSGIPCGHDVFDVQPTCGTRRVILAFFAALVFHRFDGESSLPLQAANPNRWLVCCIIAS